MKLDDLATQCEHAIKAAGPRFTPGLDPKAPNIRVTHLVDAVHALSFHDGFRVRIREHEKELREALRRTRLTMDDVFRRRTVTPAIVADDLAHLSSLAGPEEVRNQVLLIRRRCGLLGKGLEKEQEAIYRARGGLTDDDKKVRDRLDARRQDLFIVERAVSGTLSYLTTVPGTLLADKAALLILGSWGTGKTHFMCDLARTALADGTPALLALANSLDPRLDPLDALAAATGLAKNGEALLEQLDALGGRSKRRALILIDAINEGDHEVWRRSVAAVTRKISAYENVGLVLTCRTPFDSIILDDRSRSLLVAAEHYGFEDREFDAQVEFFSYYSIPAPHVPLITQEFSRPLFLKILCEALSRLSRGSRGRKLHEISSGQKGMNYVLEYFINKVGADIERAFGLSAKSCWVLLKGRPRAGRPGLAGLMAADSRDWVLPAAAVSEVRAQTAFTAATAQALLSRFVTDGLLSKSATYDSGAWVEVLTFPYQRFGDHIVARHLLDAHLDTSTSESVRRCFYANRPLGKIFVLDGWRTEFREPGLAAAIMLEFPERMKRTGLNRELLGYLPRDRRLVAPVKDALLEGLYWRSADSFTEETNRLIDFLLDLDDDEVRFETLEVLVALAARHEHPYNASRLHRYLSAMSPVERDLRWSEYIRTGGDLGALRRVLAWVERRRHSRTPQGVVKNDITLLSLGLTTTERMLRDRLTRGILEIGLRHPKVLFERVLDSLSFNDPYVPERMLAAAYGVSMRLWADLNGQPLREAIVPFARQLVREMFLPGALHGTFHTLIGDYALGIIELCRKIAPTAIATQHVRYLKRPMTQLTSPFRPAAQITEADIKDAGNALHMDFENYTIGQLISDRANYDNNHPEYAEVRKQILDRMRDLGYDSSRFESIDRQIGRNSFQETESGKTDRYGKKYSWIAFFEMYGVREDHRQLPDWRQGERTSDCDLDPSFPSSPREWKPRLPRPFQNSPVKPAEWLVEGPAPNYRNLLHRRTVDRQHGPWILLEGYITQAGDHDREVFTFLRSVLVDERYFERLRELIEQEVYLGNSRIPEPPSDYYTYMGEIPWSTRYGPDLRNGRGVARRQIDRAFLGYENGRWTGIPVEVPVRRWAWESYHSELTQAGTVTFPAPAICDALGLVNHGDALDLRDPAGRIATLYREWPNENGGFFGSHLLYIRDELIRQYLKQTRQRLVWVPWGERTLHHELLNRTKDPDVHKARRYHQDNYGELILFDS